MPYRAQGGRRIVQVARGLLHVGQSCWGQLRRGRGVAGCRSDVASMCQVDHRRRIRRLQLHMPHVTVAVGQQHRRAHNRVGVVCRGRDAHDIARAAHKANCRRRVGLEVAAGRKWDDPVDGHAARLRQRDVGCGAVISARDLYLGIGRKLRLAAVEEGQYGDAACAGAHGVTWLNELARRGVGKGVSPAGFDLDRRSDDAQGRAGRQVRGDRGSARRGAPLANQGQDNDKGCKSTALHTATIVRRRGSVTPVRGISAQRTKRHANRHRDVTTRANASWRGRIAHTASPEASREPSSRCHKSGQCVTAVVEKRHAGPAQHDPAGQAVMGGVKERHAKWLD